jgi:hypothetical protein
MPRLEAAVGRGLGHGVHEVVATSQRITVLAGLTMSGAARAWRVTRDRSPRQPRVSSATPPAALSSGGSPYLSDNITRTSSMTCANQNASQSSRAPGGGGWPRWRPRTGFDLVVRATPHRPRLAARAVPDLAPHPRRHRRRSRLHHSVVKEVRPRARHPGPPSRHHQIPLHQRSQRAAPPARYPNRSARPSADPRPPSACTACCSSSSTQAPAGPPRQTASPKPPSTPRSPGSNETAADPSSTAGPRPGPPEP